VTDSSAPALPPRLPDRGRRRTPIVIAAVAVVVVAAVAIVLGVTRPWSAGAAADGKGRTVSIGVTDASQTYWKTFTKLAKQKYDVTIKLVNFSDYSQPNPALSQSQTDLNEFQHIQYLANYNVTAHDDLQPISATAVYPLPLYSLKYTDVKSVPEGAEVAIPNDAINEARGLLVLQAAGLLKLKGGGTAFSSTADITSSSVKVTPLAADQTARALQSGSVAAAIVNKNFATDAGLKNDAAIYADDPDSSAAAPYVNVFVARAKDKDDALYRKLGQLYHDATVEKQVQEANGGTAVFRDLTAAKLQADLKKVEADARAASAQ
jgi:D-methionine transport system substrate-binding protein